MQNILKKILLNDLAWLLEKSEWATRQASRIVVNSAVSVTRNRPHPLSTFSDYPSWLGLTDRTYLARHLPPAEAPSSPDIEAIRALFARPEGAPKLSNKSTCLFPAFAQYLTDGFLRTVPADDTRFGYPKPLERTTSNHEIDLCPLYGRLPVQTHALRLRSTERGSRGLLKSQIINGEEYPPFLYLSDGQTLANEEFANLDPPLISKDLPVEKKAMLFAVGGDRVNSTPHTAMMNTLFLREHNRIARLVQHHQSAWDDDRVFDTARNTIIAMFIKIVLEDYINHITPFRFRLRADPALSHTAIWNRTNWMTVEFSLLYRWHALMPDAIVWPSPASADRQIPLLEFIQDNAPLMETGLDAAFSAASRQPAGAIGPFNTSPALLHIEDRAIAQGRSNRLPCYNNYRRAFGLAPATEFEQISSDPEVAGLLRSLYGSPDKVEFYVGLMAEDRVSNSPLPELLLRMVAVDAFSQALTNPLLSEHVWTRDTFSAAGFEAIEQTHSLSDVLERNVPHRGDTPITMTRSSFR